MLANNHPMPPQGFGPQFHEAMPSRQFPGISYPATSVSHLPPTKYNAAEQNMPGFGSARLFDPFNAFQTPVSSSTGNQHITVYSEAYGRPGETLGKLMLAAVREADIDMMKYTYPVVYTDSDTFAWDKMIAPPHVLAPMAFLAPPPTTVMRTSRKEVTLGRYHIGTVGETNFLAHTLMGKQSQVMKFQQIVQATLRTMLCNIVEEIMRVHEDVALAAEVVPPASLVAFRNTIRQEVFNFAPLCPLTVRGTNQDPLAKTWMILEAAAMQNEHNHIPPGVLIVPPDTAAFSSITRQNKPYALTGKTSERSAEQSYKTVDGSTRAPRVFTWPRVTLGPNDGPTQLGGNVACFGQYFRSLYNECGTPQDYHSGMRTIETWAEGENRHVPRTLEMMLEYCGLFDDYWNLTELGHAFFRGYTTIGDWLKQTETEQITMFPGIDNVKTFLKARNVGGRFRPQRQATPAQLAEAEDTLKGTGWITSVATGTEMSTDKTYTLNIVANLIEAKLAAAPSLYLIGALDDAASFGRHLDEVKSSVAIEDALRRVLADAEKDIIEAAKNGGPLVNGELGKITTKLGPMIADFVRARRTQEFHRDVTAVTDAVNALEAKLGENVAGTGASLRAGTDRTLDNLAKIDGFDNTFYVRNAPISKIGLFFRKCITENVPVPLSFYIFEPNVTFTMGTAAVMPEKVGVTATNIPDIREGTNPHIKKSVVHFSVTMSAITRHEESILVCQNADFQTFQGGSQLELWKATPQIARRYRSGDVDPLSRGGFVIAVPPDTNKMHDISDITGHYNTSIEHAELYPTARMYCNFWGWRRESSMAQNLSFTLSPEADEMRNTVIIQGPQYHWVNGDRRYVAGAGHLGAECVDHMTAQGRVSSLNARPVPPNRHFMGHQVQMV